MSLLSWTDTTGRRCRYPQDQGGVAGNQGFSEIGMNDSYRTIHPDEVSTPGYTWTPVPSEQEILDRLDFVLYSGCKVTDSFITGESEATSDVVVSPYPSDHRMVTSCFNF